MTEENKTENTSQPEQQITPEQQEFMNNMAKAEANITHGKKFITSNIVGMAGGVINWLQQCEQQKSKGKKTGPGFQMANVKLAAEVLAKLAEAAHNFDTLGGPQYPGMRGPMMR